MQHKMLIRNRLKEIDPYPFLKEFEDHKSKFGEFMEELKKREPPAVIPVGQNLSEIIPQ